MPIRNKKIVWIYKNNSLLTGFGLEKNFVEFAQCFVKMLSVFLRNLQLRHVVAILNDFKIICLTVCTLSFQYMINAKNIDLKRCIELETGMPFWDKDVGLR